MSKNSRAGSPAQIDRAVGTRDGRRGSNGGWGVSSWSAAASEPVSPARRFGRVVGRRPRRRPAGPDELVDGQRRGHLTGRVTRRRLPVTRRFCASLAYFALPGDADSCYNGVAAAYPRMR